MAPASNVLLYSLEQPLGYTNLVGLRHLLSPWWILELNGIIENRYPGNRNSLHKLLPVSPQPWGTDSFTGLRRLVQKQLEDGILDQAMMDGLCLLQLWQSAWTKAWSFESNAKEGVYIVRHLNNPSCCVFFSGNNVFKHLISYIVKYDVQLLMSTKTRSTFSRSLFSLRPETVFWKHFRSCERSLVGLMVRETQAETQRAGQTLLRSKLAENWGGDMLITLLFIQKRCWFL